MAPGSPVDSHRTHPSTAVHGVKLILVTGRQRLIVDQVVSHFSQCLPAQPTVKKEA